MKKFKFRLEQVLKYRTSLKEERKRELALKNLKKNEAVERLDGLERAQRGNGIRAGETLQVEDVLLTGLYGVRLKQEVDDQRLAVLQAEQEVEEARASYIEAAKEANALDMLKERKRQAYLEKVFKEEEKVIDEMATQRSKRSHV